MNRQTDTVSKRKVFVLTGKRGGFGAMVPLLRKIRDSDFLELQLVVTDQHLSKFFGETVREVESEFRIAERVDLNQSGSSAQDRGSALGRCLSSMMRVLGDLDPDLVLLYGDRGEVLATAIAALTHNIPIAHIQGGDISGSTDDSMRHAISKLATIHFPSNHASALRLYQMGEEPWRVHVVGDNHLDEIYAGSFMAEREVRREIGVEDKRPVLVVLQHPETFSANLSGEHMRETLEAIAYENWWVVVLYPCSDVGYEESVRVIESYKQRENFRVYRNLDAHVFRGLLNIASALIGNSSAGIIEAAAFRLPAINIGLRQVGRLVAENVLHVGHSRDEIRAAVDCALYDENFLKRVGKCEQLYGDGSTADKIVKVLKQVQLSSDLMRKQFIEIESSV